MVMLMLNGADAADDDNDGDGADDDDDDDEDGDDADTTWKAEVTITTAACRGGSSDRLGALPYGWDCTSLMPLIWGCKSGMAYRATRLPRQKRIGGLAYTVHAVAPVHMNLRFVSHGCDG